jgi:glucose dehydrogenase
MSTNFASENRAFSFVFCALVSLSCLPVMALHYWQNLEGVGLLAIVGLLLADSVLWFASHWSTSASTGSLRACSLVVKFVLARVMIANAAACVAILRSDRQTATATAQASAARVAEIAARAAAARDLAATLGGDKPRERLRRSPQAKLPPRSPP